MKEKIKITTTDKVLFTERGTLLADALRIEKICGGNGKCGEAGVHKNPQPIVEYNGRLWNTLEWGAWGRGYHPLNGVLLGVYTPKAVLIFVRSS